MVILLGIVIGAMQALKQPTTDAQLDALFQPEPHKEKLQANHSEFSSEVPLLTVESPTGRIAQNSFLDSETGVDLSQIEDNTYFRPQENNAWFAILDGLRSDTSAQIRKESVGNVTYAQLLAQPNAYRGKVVTVQGKVLRQEELKAPANDVGITAYHRLVLRPKGGGVWPIIIYSLELPKSFPRGDQLDIEVAVQGVFFKNWSYAWEKGLGLAPVLLAKTVGSQLNTSEKLSANDSRSVFPQPPNEPTETAMGSFREVLELVGLGPTKLESFSAGQNLTDADWQILTQLFARLQRHNAELGHWTLPVADMTSESSGELFELTGIVFEHESITVPVEFAPLLKLSAIYRCRLRISDKEIMTVYTSEVPNRWLKGESLNEPVRCRAVLLQDDGENRILVSNHLSWFPEKGLPSGQLLLAQHGMDASLWDSVKQRGEFASPESSRESEAFFACLNTLNAIPNARLTELLSQQLDLLAKSESDKVEGVEEKIAATVAQEAQRGFSSVVPMFLTPEKVVGELVRLEGIARRAVRIVEEAESDESLQTERRNYYELELFTPDSQNLPVICCVSQLPDGFPLGDVIREQIRLEGVFFKSWRYRSRKLVDANGETTHQQQRYTPIVLAETVTWIKQVPVSTGWWELAAGSIFLILLAAAWVKFAVNWRNDRRRPASDEQIDLPNL